MKPEINILIDHVELATGKAISQPIYSDLRGFSTVTLRSLVSALCNLQFEVRDTTYCEIGLYAGGTFCGSLSQHRPWLRAIGIENRSQQFEGEDMWPELNRNVDARRENAKEVRLFDEDAFTMDVLQLPGPIDILFYDGEHSYEATAEVLRRFLPALSSSFIYMIDDCNWEPVHAGMREALVRAPVEVKRRWLLSDAYENGPLWGNGVDIYVMRKL